MNFIRNFKFSIGLSLSLIAVFFIFQNGTCSTSSSSGSNSADTASTGSTTSTSNITLTASSTTVNPGGTVTFTASGGTAPYYFSAVSGGCYFASGASGVCTAPSYAGTCIVEVQDSGGSPIQTASVSVGSSNASSSIVISPANPTVGYHGTVNFTLSGGTTPYHFSFIGTSLGILSASISDGGATPIFTAGATAGSVELEVTDANNLSQYTTITVGSSAASGSTYKFVSATASSTSPNTNYTWPASHLIDGSTANANCWSSAMYGSATAASPYFTLTLGDATTGATGGTYSVDHLYLAARGTAPSYEGFPLSYTLYYTDGDGDSDEIGTFSTQPGSDGVARISFPAVIAAQITVIATYMTTDGNAGHYYFQMCEVTH